MKRLNEPRSFIQILSGPRQVGKTTLVMQLEESSAVPQIYASADEAQTRDRHFVYAIGSKILAIEVKSGQRQHSRSGLTEFKKRYPECRSLIVGSGGVPLEEFLGSSPWDCL